MVLYGFNMLSATLTFAQTHHCDITETITVLLGSCESKQGQRWHVKDTLNTVIFMRKQYHLIIMGSKSATPYDQYAERANNTPPSMAKMLNRVITSRLSSFMTEQNPPPPMTKMLNGLTTSILSS